jgi:hypothetical protein
VGGKRREKTRFSMATCSGDEREKTREETRNMRGKSARRHAIWWQHVRVATNARGHARGHAFWWQHAWVARSEIGGTCISRMRLVARGEIGGKESIFWSFGGG